jgi:hypothetical protein
MNVLKAINFKSDAQLYASRQALCFFAPFALAADNKNKLVVVSDASAMPHQPPTGVSSDKAFHPFFLRLSTKSSQVIPQYVLPLGRLVKTDAAEDIVGRGSMAEPKNFQDTNYVVVVDVTDKNNKFPVWLIYNYNPISLSAGVRVELAVKSAAAKSSLFPTVTHVDSVKVLDSVKDWAGSGGLSMRIQELVTIFGQGNRVGAVQSSAAAQDEVAAALTPPP